MVQMRDTEYGELTIKDKIHFGVFSSIYTVRLDGGIYAVKIPRLDEGDIGGREVPREEENEADRTFLGRIGMWHNLWESAPNDIIRPIATGTMPFPWVVMELADGNFSSALKDGTAGVGDIIRILDSLSRVRDRSIVHGNVEPDNILMVDGRWKFGDFGISFEGDAFRTIDLRVTVSPYAAPEMISIDEFGQVDERTDVWQVGVMLYRVLTNRMPFESDECSTDVSIIKSVPEISLVPEEYRPVITKALTKDKDGRYATASEFAAALRAVSEKKERY